MNDLATMLAFGASDAACYKWPEDTELDKACRAAFCDGAASNAAKIETDAKVIAALREKLDLIWHIAPLPTQSETERLKRILKIAREARHVNEQNVGK